MPTDKSSRQQAAARTRGPHAETSQAQRPSVAESIRTLPACAPAATLDISAATVSGEAGAPLDDEALSLLLSLGC